MMVDHTFHSEAIAKRYPDYSHIPYASTRQWERDSGPFYRRFALNVLRSCLGPNCPFDSGALLLRLMRCAADPQYGATIMWLGPLTIYLTQLSRLRARFAAECEDRGLGLVVPSVALCTDNGAMVAAAGSNLLADGASSDLGLAVDPSLPLTA
jgi:hypothetical protein